MTDSDVQITTDDQATRLRGELADSLVAEGRITSRAVEKAFRTVPREVFVLAGTALEATYSIDQPVVLKTDAHGRSLSSVSATYIQARMIEMAGVAPGMRVLEIGSGGYNAALLAEIVGPAGQVVSVDIDADITDRASDLLDRTGYTGRVTVMQADAHHPVPGYEAFDRILVTVGAWDIAPAWLSQLGTGGVLVVPLRMNGVTRTIAFRRHGDHLASTDTEVAGFVPMQGDGAHHDHTLTLQNPSVGAVTLQFATAVPDPAGELGSVLTGAPVAAWSGVTIGNQVSFADLHLWLACWLPGFCRIEAQPATEPAADLCTKWFPFGALHEDSFTCLAVRPVPEGQGPGVEFGAIAHGAAAATCMVEQIRAWHRHARHQPPPSFHYWPTSSDLTQLSADAALLEKDDGLVTITWPTGG